MPLQNFLKRLDQLQSDAESAFSGASNSESLEEARVVFLGAKNGQFKDVQKMLGTIESADKRAAGMRLNEVKNAINEAFNVAKIALGSDVNSDFDPTFDPSLPGIRPVIGHIHPITQTIDHLTEIMGRMGFEVAEGPEVEDPWHNFVALNIPEDHPARDPLDNFYLATAAVSGGSSTERGGRNPGTDGRKPGSTVAGQDGNETGEGESLLRSQTSTVQIRVMRSRQPPIRIISLGRVYRPDAPDATHFPMFHQMEGLLIDRQVTMANLKTVLRVFANNYLGDDVEIRFRPSFFPFTEPSVEVDFLWNGTWIEFGGAGMVDPNVLEAVGYDPEKVSGFAFGLGVERLCMRRHGITDIRDLYSGDLRFLQQF